jgi:hypothetical protein
VAEWIKADAGTGASIESGSHKCPTNCADLNRVQINKHKIATKQIFEEFSKPRLD